MEKTSRDKDKKDSFELWCIYVDPLMMRQGVGRELLEYCENEARRRGYRENSLWVLERNTIGKNFYDKTPPAESHRGTLAGSRRTDQL